VQVLEGNDLLKESMNLFHAVGRSAESQPRLVLVEYNGDPSTQERLALVGKGVTFDTGGLNLKPTGYMEDMYGDKGGACAVIGCLHGVLATRPKINIVFAMGFAENSIDSKSYKPGDIIKSRKGLTVEIGNTDAEGRLVLCDTLTYVQDKFKPHTIIDLATLTGAVKVALGNYTAGLFSNDDDLAGLIADAGKSVDESFWRLPIFDEHREAMKSSFADLNNKGNTPYGGSSQGASFLERFIEKDVRWAHLDIAGPAILKAAKPPMCADGTGFGSQTLLSFVWKHSK
jgi:leucyl aminopeptidase